MAQGNKNATGRPKIPIDHEKLKKLMAYRPTLFDVAGFFGCSRDAVQDLIKRDYNMGYKEFRAYHLGRRKIRVIQRALAMAEHGNTEMIKFVLINLAGWTNGYSQRDDFDDEDFVENIEWVDE